MFLGTRARIKYKFIQRDLCERYQKIKPAKHDVPWSKKKCVPQPSSRNSRARVKKANNKTILRIILALCSLIKSQFNIFSLISAVELLCWIFMEKLFRLWHFVKISLSNCGVKLITENCSFALADARFAYRDGINFWFCALMRSDRTQSDYGETNCLCLCF